MNTTSSLKVQVFNFMLASSRVVSAEPPARQVERRLYSGTSAQIAPRRSPTAYPVAASFG